MGLKASVRILADGADVTAAILANLVSLRLVDSAGTESDTLEIRLADNLERPVPVPRTGAELEVFLGWDGVTQRMGLFVADEVELSGPPAEMIVRARAAPYEPSNGGKKGLQTQKSRSWPKGTKLGDMVAKIAKEAGLTPAVAKALASVTLPHLDQTEESDLSFLLRVCRRYDGLVKPAGGKLAVVKRGQGESASGEKLPAVTIARTSQSAYRLTVTRRDKPGTVVAYWHNKATAKRVAEKVGEGEPTVTLRFSFPDKEAAKAAAQAELERRQRGEERLTLSGPGDASLTAEAPLVAAGFRPRVDGEWSIARVTHSVDKSGGWVTEVEAEKPAA